MSTGDGLDAFSSTFDYNTDIVISKDGIEFVELLKELYQGPGLIIETAEDYYRITFISDLGNLFIKQDIIDDKEVLAMVCGTQGYEWISTANRIVELGVEGSEIYNVGLGGGSDVEDSSISH